MKALKEAFRDMPACGYILIAVMAVLIIFMAGCATTYHVEIIKPDGTHIVADSRSYREFALFKLDYNPQTGAFSLNAVGVTDDTAEVVSQAVSTVATVVVPFLPVP